MSDQAPKERKAKNLPTTTLYEFNHLTHERGKNPEPKLEILWLYLGGHVNGLRRKHHLAKTKVTKIIVVVIAL